MRTISKGTSIQFNLSTGRRVRFTLEEWRELRMLFAGGALVPPKPAALPVQRITPDLSKAK
jgi:hypothetical protein